MSGLLKNEDYVKKSIGMEISTLRKRKKVKAIELSGFLNISKQHVSRYERGVCCIKTDVLIYILYSLNCPLNEFFFRVSMRLKKISPNCYKKNICILYSKEYKNKYFKAEKYKHFS